MLVFLLNTMHIRIYFQMIIVVDQLTLVVGSFFLVVGSCRQLSVVVGIRCYPFPGLLPPNRA